MALQIGYLLSIAIQLKLWTSERSRAIEGTSGRRIWLIEDVKAIWMRKAAEPDSKEPPDRTLPSAFRAIF